MFKLFAKPKPKGTLLTLHISGMHCTSCSLNIDGELEDLPGVYSSTTSYAKSQTVIDYNPKQVSLDKLHQTIEKLGYKISI